MRALLTLSALALLPSVLLAQSGGPVRFVERPGQLEFSGELIAKPLQPEALATRGVVGARADRIQTRARDRVLRLPDSRRLPQLDWVIFDVPKGETESSFATKLMATGDYEYVEPNWRVFTTTVPNDPLFAQQYHHTNIKSTDAWLLHTGANVTLGIVDSGNDLAHPDLSALYVPGYNARDRRRQVDGGAVGPFDSHGTHVSGCAAAHGNNGVGLTGVGWNFRIMPIRCMGANGEWPTWQTLADGAIWAVDNGARLVNMSWTGVDLVLARDTGAYVRSKGGLLFWAAGNDARNLSGFDWEEVTVVGASTQADTRAGFSAFGRAIDVFAPGDNIYATVPGGYGFASGTSMATPIALGVAAMVWSVNPNLSNEEVETIVENTSDSIGDPTVFGFGRVNTSRAVRAAEATVGVRWEAESFNVERGRLVSGDLNDLVLLDGRSMVFERGLVLNQQESPITVSFGVNIGGGAVQGLRYSYAGRSTSVNVTQTLEMFDWSANAYVQLDQRTAPLTDTIVSGETTNSARFVSQAGDIRFRVRYRSSGPTSQNAWQAAANQLFFVVRR